MLSLPISAKEDFHFARFAHPQQANKKRRFFFSAKDDSKSPVRGGGGRISVTAPPSRKPSATNNVSNLSSIFIPRQENNDWDWVVVLGVGGAYLMLYQLLFGPFLLIMQNWIGAGVFKIWMKYFELRHFIPVLHKNASVKIALHDSHWERPEEEALVGIFQVKDFFVWGLFIGRCFQ